MAEKTVTGRAASLIKIGSGNGHTIVEQGSPLRRLHYFDGKFLRAPDLLLEQQALLNQIRIANRAGGAGIVHGFDCRLAGDDNLFIDAGLAFDPEGRALMLHQDIQVAIDELIGKSRAPFFAELPASIRAKKAAEIKNADFDDCIIRREEPEVGIAESSDLYLISLHHAEAYCGEEDVYGKLCSEACTTSTNRSYIIEGVEVRATSLELSVLLKQSRAVALSDTHLRSRVASAYFEQESQLIAYQISASGLTSNIWCLGAEAAGGNGVPIAVISRRGGTTVFLDAWTARRERMETPPRHYWAGRMMMRPWKMFLAQILQFQCQLRACLSSSDPNAPRKKLVDFDPYADTRQIAGQAAEGMRFLLDRMEAMASRLSDFSERDLATAQLDVGKDLSELEKDYQQLIDVSRIAVPDRLMINCGIVEVPSAGYLPVNISSTVSVNEQVTRLFGPGVDLRFCVVRPDFVAHALEEAQHMERICLLRGLEDASKRPEVDILVPNGEIEQREVESPGTGYRADIKLNGQLFELGWPRPVFQQAARARSASEAAETDWVHNLRDVETKRSLPAMSGAARGERAQEGSLSFYCAAQSGRQAGLQKATLTRARRNVDAVLELLDGGNAEAEAEETTTDDFALAERSHAHRLSSGFHINTNLKALDQLVSSRSSLVPGVVLWLELNLEDDPFQMANDETTTFRAKSTVVFTRTINQVRQVTIEERLLNGQLRITQSAPQKTDTKLTARLIADGHWRRVRFANTQPTERSESVKLDEKVIVSRAALTGLPPTIAIQLVNPSFFAGLDNVQLVFERSWVSATESRSRVLLRYQNKYRGLQEAIVEGADAEKALARSRTGEWRSAGRDYLLADARLTEDADVLKPGNDFHSDSLNALAIIGKATDNSGFADRAGSLLFPPPPKLPEALRILARGSWVLFHRRRTKVCARPEATEVAVKPRQYRLYHIHLPAQTDVEQVVEALSANAGAAIARFDAKPVTRLTFAPGLPAIQTGHDDLRSDWQAAVRVTTDVHIGLIASGDEAVEDGEALADARLQRVTHLLAPISEPSDDLAQLSVHPVPAILAAGEVDGVIVYFTKTVATQCHTLYRLMTDSIGKIHERLAAFLNTDRDLTLSQFLQHLGAETLSVNPRFESGSDTFYGGKEAQRLAASWDVVGNGPISRVLTLAAGESTQQQAVSRQQAVRISEVLGSNFSAEDIRYLPAPPRLFTACPKTTLLVTETQCHDVYLYVPTASSPAKVYEALRRLAEESGITEAMLNVRASFAVARVPAFTRLQPLNFYKDTNEAEDNSREEFQLKWQGELKGTPARSLNGYVLALARSVSGDAAATADNVALARKQAYSINALMGIDNESLETVANNADVDFPVDCSALSLFILERPFQDEAIVANRIALTREFTPRDTAEDGSGEEAQPALSLNIAQAIRFNSDNALIRDDVYKNTVKWFTENNDEKISEVALVSLEGEVNEAEEIKANELLRALKEEGLAKRNAKVVKRAANDKEKVEIVRSGFALNHGLVLR